MTDRLLVLDKVTPAVTALTGRIRALGVPLWKALSFSPADDSIAPRSCICAVIDKGSISVTHASRMISRFRIKAYRKYTFTEGHYPTAEEVAATVALAIKDMHAGRSELVLSMPKAWVVAKTGELPSAAMENLSEVVSFELDRLTPFSAAEALYDYMVLGEDKEKVSLFVAAVKADIVDRYLAALKEMGTTVARITFDLPGIAALCRYMAGKNDFIFLIADAAGFKGGAVIGGSVCASESCDFAGADDSQKAKTIEEHIASLALLFKGQSGTPPVMLSCTSTSAGLKEMIRQRSRHPVSIVEDMDKKIGGIAGFKDITPAAIGGAIEHLWPKAKGINMLAKGARENPKTPFVLSIVLALVIMILFGTYLAMPIKIETKRLAEIQKQISLRKEEIKKVERLKKDVEVLEKELAQVEEFKYDRPMYVDMIKELTMVLPRNTWLTRVRIAGAQVNIEGYASSATVLIPKLEASKYFRKVEMASPTFKDVRLNMDRFQIKMELKDTKRNADKNDAKQ